MKTLKNVLLSLGAVSLLSACGNMPAKDFIHRPASLILPAMPADEELSCLPEEVFIPVIERDSALFNRVKTLEELIDAHNK